MVKKLKDSGEWLTTSQLARKLKCTEENVRQYFPSTYPESTIRFVGNNKKFCLYHTRITDEYKRKNKNNFPKDSLNNIAHETGMTYSQMRGIANRLKIGKSNGKYKQLTEEEIDTLKSISLIAKNRLERALAKLNPNKNYSFRQMESMGIPISHFDKDFRLKHPHLETKEIRTISGEDIVCYLKNNYQTINLVSGLRLLTSIRPHLYTTSDIIQVLPISRTNLL